MAAAVALFILRRLQVQSQNLIFPRFWFWFFFLFQNVWQQTSLRPRTLSRRRLRQHETDMANDPLPSELPWKHLQRRTARAARPSFYYLSKGARHVLANQHFGLLLLLFIKRIFWKKEYKKQGEIREKRGIFVEKGDDRSCGTGCSGRDQPKFRLHTNTPNKSVYVPISSAHHL